MGNRISASASLAEKQRQHRSKASGVVPTLHLAWTVDDGPTQYTSEMAKNFPGNKRPATWYIQRDRITEQNISIYQTPVASKRAALQTIELNDRARLWDRHQLL